MIDMPSLPRVASTGWHVDHYQKRGASAYPRAGARDLRCVRRGGYGNCGPGLIAGLPVRNAALLANVAAGIVVGKTGTATARLDEIRAALEAEPVTEKTFVTSNFTLVCPGRASVASGSNSWKKGLLLSPQSGLRKC